MFSDLGLVFKLAVEIFFRGGWVLFLWLLLYMFYKLYIDYIQIRWYKTLKWVFLQIKVPKENETSPLAFEHIFNQLHSIHANITWAERQIEGQFQIWFTWEITSIGGQISHYVKILEKHRDILEAAVYSQFPQAEISEAEDYFEKLPRYHPDTSEYDIFGYNFLYIKPSVYPMKTYPDFEHAAAETMIDPMTGLWEELSKISPYEMYIVQFILRPLGNDDRGWKKHGYHFVQKLKGVPEEHHGGGFAGFVGSLIGPILDAIIRPTPTQTKPKKEEPPSLMLHLSEGEKTVISAVERKLSKWCYDTKFQCMYIAPKEKYNPGHINTAIIGAVKSYGTAEMNALKPLLKRWTKINYLLFSELEKPILNLRLKFRKREFMHRMKLRWYFWGPHANILSVEELASLIHFPQINVTVPDIQKVPVTKVQPPPELPIAPL